MRFIHRWSFLCAKYLTKQLNQNHDKRRIYYYGFQIVIGAIVKAFLLIGTSVLLGTLIPSVIAVLIFGSFRMLAGGYHMDTYGKCIWVSLAIFISIGIVAQYTYLYWSMPMLLAIISITFVLTVCIAIKWAPKDTLNKPITDPVEIKKFKRLSLVYTIAFTISAVVGLYFKFDTRIIIASCFGLLMESFSITPAGHKFFDKISKFSYKKPQ
jgi:accessory gene regulator B